MSRKWRFCLKGHDLSETKNVYVVPSTGVRCCKVCRCKRDKIYHKKHRDKKNARSSQWQKDNRKRTREKQRQRDTGWTSEHFNSVLKKQRKRCAICSKKFNNKNKPHADHCHRTKNTRGILCGNCNFGIGNLQDSPDILEAAAAYLRRYQIGTLT